MNILTELSDLTDQTAGIRTPEERAKIVCRLARELEKDGDYEAAFSVLAEFWPDRSKDPVLGDLGGFVRGELLLRIGAVAGWLGACDQTSGSQEAAKNLITSSIEVFESLGLSEKVAEARSEIGLCYWREGSYDEARIQLASGLRGLGEGDTDLKARILIRAGIVEVWASRFNEAVRYYNLAEPLVDRSPDHGLKGSFHNEFGLVLRKLAAPENREDYLDRALIEYSAASFHFGEAGNTRAVARVEANLGYLFFTITRYFDAHKHLDRARKLFLDLGDIGTAARVDESRARTLLAEGRIVEAESLIKVVVRTLESGGEQGVLADALTTYGVVVARLGHQGRAKVLLERAMEVAETTGDIEGAGRARLSVIEELIDKLPVSELISIYRGASDGLRSSQDPESAKRLIVCADSLFEVVANTEGFAEHLGPRNWEGFSYKKETLKQEAALIERALRDAGGAVTRAARLLGFNNHQGLISLINSRHKQLLKIRTAVRKRRRSIVSGAQIGERVAGAARFSVLHIGDTETLGRLVAETPVSDWIHFESCRTGKEGVRMLSTSGRSFDLIVVGDGVPDERSLELVTRIRSLVGLRKARILLVATADCEKEAWRAGVSGFVAKGQGFAQLSSKITRLLEGRGEQI